MRKLYIADDEPAIREGLRLLVDWQKLGYEICGEAANGTDALTGIRSQSPDLVLMDIRMPGILGLDVIETLTREDFKGHFIILSGYSDFKYAQSAMKFNVRHYLTKPIDEDELTDAVNEITRMLDEERSSRARTEFLRAKSKREVIIDILDNTADHSDIDLKELGFDASCYQIVAYESFRPTESGLPYQFFELFKAAGGNSQTYSFEHFEYKHHNLLLLIGSSGIERFKRFLAHYETAPEKNSPLDTLFIAYGCTVTDLQELHVSYKQACELLGRRFFCVQGQHVLGFDDLPSVQDNLQQLENSRISVYTAELTDYLQTFNRRRIAESLYSLEEYLYHVSADISAVKLFLADLYLQIKEAMTHRYSAISPNPFDSNSAIIGYISNCKYLYEIITYFSKQFETIMNAIGNSSRDSVMDDILYYIDHNYQTNLKLEIIASLFGYNSSYLGKIFNKTVGESFNTYVDRIRVSHAIELLNSGDLKVYEIAERVGYRNVDYFHKKFKKYVGVSPAEYRKK